MCSNIDNYRVYLVVYGSNYPNYCASSLIYNIIRNAFACKLVYSKNCPACTSINSFLVPKAYIRLLISSARGVE